MNEIQNRIMDEIAGKCARDQDFRAQLLAAPETVMRTMGLPLPADQQVQAIHDEGQGIRLVFLPKANSLSDTQLDQVVGGARFSIPLNVQDMPGKTVLVFLKPPNPQRAYMIHAWKILTGSAGAGDSFDFPDV